VSYVDLNLTLATARRDPYLPATINISDHLYTSFINANTDDTLNEGECGSFSDFNLPEVGVRIGAAATSNAATGVLHDPGGPYDNYGNNIDLQGVNGFIIDPADATDLQITFTEFNMQFWDSIYVTQLDTDNSTPMGAGRQRFDGANIPGSFNFDTGQALIEFTSIFWWTAPGFTLSWNHLGGPATTLVQEKLDEAGCRASANCTLVKDLPLSAINTQENYANWFSYYRTRELVAKKAMSDIIFENDQRLGLATLKNNDSVGTLVKDMRVSANKTELLTNLFKVRSSGTTPLRRALDSAGRYFQEGTAIPTDLFTTNNGTTPNHAGDGTISNYSPILNQAGGGICQQNFSVLFSDGEWTNNNIDALNVDDRDGDGDSPYDGGTFADTFGPLADNVNDTLADVAMRYLEEDLAGGLSDSNTVVDIHHIEVPPSERRVIPQQHMSTYTVAFGLTGTLDGNPGGPDLIPSTVPTPVYVFPGWTNPNNAARKTDDMRHAAWNCR
jgi:hypothetical protein